MKRSNTKGTGQRRAAGTPDERISRLCAALGRITSSLDLGTVLREVVDGVRGLTGARYGAIVTIDGSGAPRDFLTRGFTKKQHRAMAAWPDGPRLFEYLRDLDGPLRLADFPGFVSSLGLDWDLLPVRTLMGAPMRHRGAHVGNFYLIGKEGEFTGGDEELLALFASQAAAAIAHARAHQEEQRARAGLEALVETSPVGVVVFDAQTGEPATVNREARRIVEVLGLAGRSAADLLGEATSRLPDGREVTLEDLKSAGTLRGAEVEISVPAGRSIRVLVNATPIRAGEDVESVVVTMQDLAPLEELERLRIEFLGMVSHELRAPLASIKGCATTLLNAPRELERAETRQFVRLIDRDADQMQGLIGDLLDAGRIRAGTLSVDPEAVEAAALVEQARTTFLGGGGRRRELRLELGPDLPRVMADERRIVQVLNNLISNAARHSPETSPIEVGAAREGAFVALWVADQGRGFEPGRLPHLFQRYAEAGARDAGFGLGLVICKGLVEAHGGRIRAESAGPGLGARFTFTLPAAEEEARAAGPPRPGGKAGEAASVLVVDDDPETLRHVREALSEAGCVPHMTGDPEEAARLVRTVNPDLALLDLMLPGTDGVELMRETPGLADVPVIFISAYGREENIVHALDAGAADYIVKPFSAAELTARVRAALRRRAGPEPFALGELAIDYDERRVTVAGRPVELTPTEYALLRALSLNAGRVATYDSLLRQAWGGREGAGPDEVRNFVKRLRQKLGDDPAKPSFIVTVRGVGYRMARPAEP